MDAARRVLDPFPPDLRDLFRALDVDTLFRDHATGRDQIYETLLADHIRSIYGPAGSAFITNTYGLHRGNRPRHRPRQLAVVRYGLFRNFNDTHRTKQGFAPIDEPGQLARIPDDVRARYVNRLLLNTE